MSYISFQEKTLNKNNPLINLFCIPRFLCCMMFATRSHSQQSARSLSRPGPSIFCCTPHSSLLTAPHPPHRLWARLARTQPGLRQLQPAASCGRRLLAKTCLGWQSKDGPTSTSQCQCTSKDFRGKGQQQIV